MSLASFRALLQLTDSQFNIMSVKNLISILLLLFIRSVKSCDY